VAYYLEKDFLMARLPRIYLQGCSYHIVQRGNNREPCFYSEQDYATYLTFLKDSAEMHGVEIHAYVLMTNHVHMLVTPIGDGDISRMMQSLGRKYVRYFNAMYQRTGTLWEGRFKSSVVDSERYLLTVYRYIELNPVRAGMVLHASEYSWSSFQYNGAGREVQLITPHQEYLRLDNNVVKRQKSYRKSFKGLMPDFELNEIREALQKDWVLGDDRFKRMIEEKTGARRKGHGGDRKSLGFLEDQVL
jgi:putative transposase